MPVVRTPGGRRTRAYGTVLQFPVIPDIEGNASSRLRSSCGSGIAQLLPAGRLPNAQGTGLTSSQIIQTTPPTHPRSANT